ncbi:MAG TPA: segregation/condensation protein A [Bacillota bacterium]|nr:segregation/condensation protein A [Bacillota bacterium]
MAYEVKINSYEGPLDLLLHLIDKSEVDIYDIPVTMITEQYMQYLYVLQELQLDIASEFLVMAATLLEIKSKMLLPRKDEMVFQPIFDIEGDEDDPRLELVERLLEYKKYKVIAEELRSREAMRCKIFTRPAEDLAAYLSQIEENPVANVTLYDMVEALSKALSKGNKEKDRVLSKIHRDEVSVKDRIREIKEMLKMQKSLCFTQLFIDTPTRAEVVTTFMAILEMMRKSQVVCQQSTLFDDIFITSGKGV